jgi:signal transduction histidine kinase
MRHHLFLATHEAITNILKHSSAAHTNISMASGNGVFEIHISDDGKGFNLPANKLKSGSPATVSGDGLSNMCKRLADMGGHCSIESTPGHGTNIRFVISLNFPAKDV